MVRGIGAAARGQISFWKSGNRVSDGGGAIESRERRAIIWITAVAAIVALFLLAVVLMPQSGDRWNAMKSRVAKLTEDARSRNLSRPVFAGEPSPGNAWDEYSIALNVMFAFKQDVYTTLKQFNDRDAKADRGTGDRLLAANPDVIEHLQRGARRTEGQYPHQWDLGAPVPDLLPTRLVTQLAIAQARIWSEEGREQDAANLLLDTAQFSGDLTTNGVFITSLVGIANYSSTLDELRNLILSRKLSRQQLADLAKKLEIVDGSYPALGPSLTNETINMPAGSGLEDWLLLVREGGWRSGLSPEQMTLDAFEQRDSLAQRSHDIDKMPFNTAMKEAQAITAATEASASPLVRMFVPTLFLSKTLVTHRETLARLRLLRAAATFLATGETPEVADPFGKSLSYALKADKLKIWSNGSDGRNQNGQGTWISGLGGDIVLEIPR